VKKLFISLTSAFLSVVAFAQNTSFFSPDDVAIKGYDPVAYFIKGQALPGNDSLYFSWSGSQWHFISAANRDSFKMDPQYYAPQFGGYCAYGVSEDHKSPTDPNAWTIIEGKLYMNYNMKVKEIWMKDSDGRIKRANTNWPSLNNK
jgi:hypothetical protein